jgi:Spy/CpxP family protein refolding chaperone
MREVCMSYTASRRLLFTILCAAVLFPATLSAQKVGPERSGSPAERIDRRVSALTERLSLSEEQAEGVRAILEEQYELLKEDRETYGDDREAMREIVMGRMKRADAKIMELLTDEQKAEFQKYKKERREEMRMRRERPVDR